MQRGLWTERPPARTQGEKLKKQKDMEEKYKGEGGGIHGSGHGGSVKDGKFMG